MVLTPQLFPVKSEGWVWSVARALPGCTALWAGVWSQNVGRAAKLHHADEWHFVCLLSETVLFPGGLALNLVPSLTSCVPSTK